MNNATNNFVRQFEIRGKGIVTTTYINSKVGEPFNKKAKIAFYASLGREVYDLNGKRIA
jgi:hypothetical protein